MKKLRLNNIFHWLYALLMFLPFILFIGFCLVSFGVSFDGQSITDIFFEIVDDCCNLWSYSPLSNVFFWIDNFFGGTSSLPVLFVYWIIVSFHWLCFDVLMFIVNLAHRWIDRGSDL